MSSLKLAASRLIKPVANSTAPPDSIHSGASILPVELMAVDAVSRLRPMPTSHVFETCDGFDVLRVGTGSVSAQVVSLKLGWEWPNKMLVCQAVRQPSSPIEPESPVTQRETGTDPLPAPIVENTNLLPKTEGECVKLVEHRNQPFGVVQPEVIGLAAALLYHENGSHLN